MPPPVLSMSHDDCLDRLGSTPIGRVAVTSRALPAVVPVNFTLCGNSVIFRTEPQGMLARACDGAVVAFEIDDLAPDGLSGWSVLVVGVAELLEGSAAVRAVASRLVSAVGDGRDQFVAIRIGTVTGRHVDRIPAEAV